MATGPTPPRPAKPVALVLLPGLDGTGLMFRPLLEALPPALEPIVVSYPGDRPCGYRELLPLVERAIPADRDCLLLGESFAGPLALLAAARAPGTLRGVILCATFARNPLRWFPSWLRFLAVGPVFALWPALIRVRASLGRYGGSDLVPLALRAIGTVRPATVAARVRALLAVDVERELRECPVPILYLQGTRDTLIGAHNAERIRAVAPAVRVERLEVSHFVLQLAPQEAVAAIERFLETLA